MLALFRQFAARTKSSISFTLMLRSFFSRVFSKAFFRKALKPPRGLVHEPRSRAGRPCHNESPTASFKVRAEPFLLLLEVRCPLLVAESLMRAGTPRSCTIA